MRPDLSPIMDSELEMDDWHLPPGSPPSGLVSVKRKRSLDFLEASAPFMPGVSIPSTVPLTEFVGAQMQQLLGGSSAQPMVMAMNNQRKLLQEQQLAITAASALSADMKLTMAECQHAQ